jgi:hypothetical protein
VPALFLVAPALILKVTVVPSDVPAAEARKGMLLVVDGEVVI